MCDPVGVRAHATLRCSSHPQPTLLLLRLPRALRVQWTQASVCISIPPSHVFWSCQQQLCARLCVPSFQVLPWCAAVLTLTSPGKDSCTCNPTQVPVAQVDMPAVVLLCDVAADRSQAGVAAEQRDHMQQCALLGVSPNGCLQCCQPPPYACVCC